MTKEELKKELIQLSETNVIKSEFEKIKRSSKYFEAFVSFNSIEKLNDSELQTTYDQMRDIIVESRGTI